MENELNPMKDPEPLQKRHLVFIVVAVILLAVAIFFGLKIRDQEPNFYTPGRASLVNAKRKLAESLYHENAIIKERRLAHEEIDAAITLLTSAENLDPTDRSSINDLRARLEGIEQADREGEISQNKLQGMYKELLEQINSLIKRLEEYPR
jgi:hypothetical protein